MKKNKFGQPIYPMTAEEEKIYKRLMEKYKDYPLAQDEVEAILLDPTEQRDWEVLEEMIDFL